MFSLGRVSGLYEAAEATLEGGAALAADLKSYGGNGNVRLHGGALLWSVETSIAARHQITIWYKRQARAAAARVVIVDPSGIAVFEIEVLLRTGDSWQTTTPTAINACTHRVRLSGAGALDVDLRRFD